MIFQTGHSTLVRLSDCLKMNVANALETARRIIVLHEKYAHALQEIRRIAKKYLDSDEVGTWREEVQAASAQIPEGEAQSAISLTFRLHSETLGAVLTCCFTLESYINSLGFFLSQEQAIAKEVSTLTKWEIIGRLRSPAGFDTAVAPFQDMKILFKFRNDHVHDKVVDWGRDRAKERYNDKLPDPLAGFLDLSHGVFACDTYWAMISKVHDLLDVRKSDFHKHYNLSPWFDGPFEAQVRQTAADYKRATKG
jgi:hypothetical protein